MAISFSLDEFRRKLLASTDQIRRIEIIAKDFERAYAALIETVKGALRDTPVIVSVQLSQGSYPTINGEFRTIALPSLSVRFVNRTLQVSGSIQAGVEGVTCSVYFTGSRPIKAFPTQYILYVPLESGGYKWVVPAQGPKGAGVADYKEEMLAQLLQEVLLD